jgi:hypothetical protein
MSEAPCRDVSDLYFIAATAGTVTFDTEPGSFRITDVHLCDGGGSGCDFPAGDCAGWVGMDRIDQPGARATIHIRVGCIYRVAAYRVAA